MKSKSILKQSLILGRLFSVVFAVALVVQQQVKALTPVSEEKIAEGRARAAEARAAKARYDAWVAGLPLPMLANEILHRESIELMDQDKWNRWNSRGGKTDNAALEKSRKITEKLEKEGYYKWRAEWLKQHPM